MGERFSILKNKKPPPPFCISITASVFYHEGLKPDYQLPDIRCISIRHAELARTYNIIVWRGCLLKVLTINEFIVIRTETGIYCQVVNGYPVHL